jgi:hypothetical protein
VVRVCGGEDVVCDVATHVVHVVAPFDGGGHGLGLADQDALVQNTTGVNVALDVVLAAGPGPLAAPFDARSSGSVKVRALRS